MEYKLLSATVQEKFEELVMQYLTNGWKCQGGVFIHFFPPVANLIPSSRVYYQAMIKEK